MCTLAVFFRVFPGVPLVVAANRDEFFDRPSEPPQLLSADPEIFGGRDGRSGGTWLGINRSGVVAALLNRRCAAPTRPDARSRGLLCLDALRAPSAVEARARVEREGAERYNPFNLLVGDAGALWVATNRSRQLEFFDLPPGLHLLTNLDVNDPRCPRISTAVRLFEDLQRPGPPAFEPERFVNGVHRILASHDVSLDPRSPDSTNSLCLHLEAYGTRSSSIVFLDGDRRWTYFYCEGPPCRSDFRPVPIPWQSTRLHPDRASC